MAKITRNNIFSKLKVSKSQLFKNLTIIEKSTFSTLYYSKTIIRKFQLFKKILFFQSSRANYADLF